MNRRVTLSVQLFAVVFSLVTCTALALVLSEKYGTRFDLTATREHQISEQSKAAVAKLERSVTIAVAADLTGLSKVTTQRLNDVLDALTAASPRISSKLMDTSSPAGQQAYEQLIRQMATEDKQVIEEHLAALKIAAEESTDIAERLLAAGVEVTKLRDVLVAAMPPGGGIDRVKSAWDATSAEARLFADGLTQAVTRARDILGKPLDPLPVPAADDAARVLREALTKVSSELPRINDTVDQVSLSAAVNAEAKTLARELGTRFASYRDRTARLAAGLERLGTLRVLRVASAIGRTRGCILIGAPLSGDPKAVTVGGSGELPTSLTAVDVDELLGPVASPGDAQADAQVDRRFRMEELLVAGLDAFIPRPRPLVVFVHADRGQLAPNFAPVRKLADRLALLGIDVGEWRVAVDASLPTPIAQILASGRPVVFATVSPAALPGDQASMLDQATRVSKLSAAVEALLRDGRSLLVSLVPSVLPAGGADDPLVKPLEALGIKADTGRVIMERVKTSAGSGVLTDAVLTEPMPPGIPASTASANSAPRIGQAVSGLRTRLIWPVALLLPGAEGVTLQPVLTLATTPDRWAEAEWLRLRQHRGDPSSAPAVEPGGPKDLLAPADGSAAWILAAAAERPLRDAPSGTAGTPTPRLPQRVLVVGSQGWFADAVTDAASVVDGRAAFEYPGNTELFVASVRWLCNQEDLIRRSAQAQSVPTIAGVTEGQLSALRLLVIAVMPLAVLLLGAAWKLIRG